MSRVVRSRGWIFVVNNPTDDDYALLMDIYENYNPRYIVWGEEYGDKKKTLHLQGFIYFVSQRSFSSVKKLFYPHHIEAQKGTDDQAIDYCIKDNNNVVELGERPQSGRLSWSRIEDVMKNPKDNFSLYNQYRKSYMSVVNSEVKKHERKLFIASEDDIFIIASAYGDSVSVYPSIYDGERVHIVNLDLNLEQNFFSNSYFDLLKNWCNDFPPKYKVGYEVKVYDPEHIYMTINRNRYNENDIERFMETFQPFIDLKYPDYVEDAFEKKTVCKKEKF